MAFGSKTRPREIVSIVIVRDADPDATEYDLPDSNEPIMGVAQLVDLVQESTLRASRVHISLSKVTPGANTTQNGSEYANVVCTVLSHASTVSGDRVYIGGEFLEWRATANVTTSQHVARGANATAAAANMAAAINAYANTRNLVSAESSTNTFTITSLLPGPLGRFMVGVTDDTAVSVGGTEEGDGFKRMDDAVSNTYAGVGTVRKYELGV